MKYLILDEKNLLNEVMHFLIKEIGLPQIQRRLNIYSVENDIQIEILNNKISLWGTLRHKCIFVKNKNLKKFFQYVQSKNSKGFLINDIELLKFSSINLLFNTFHGDILSTEDIELVEKLAKIFNLKIYNNINDHKPVNIIKPEFLFDEMGNLNEKIKNYSNKTGLDIRSSSSSLRVRLSNLSNDYSHIEKYYKLITGEEILSFNSKHVYESNFKDMSIIIPVYNQNVIPTLLSIQSQNISKENKSKIQVVIIDDGSKNNVAKEIETIKEKLDYQLDVISLGKNMGLSNARNVGLAVARNDLLLFIDSDIILSKDYIYDINIRLQIVPNAIFVAMRKNIEPDSDILNEENLLKGIERSLEFDDSRVVTQSKEYHVGWDKAYENETITILDDSDYFKQLSFGSKIGIYDISTVVTGCNIAINRKQITKYPAFSNRFVGWGMEDAYFASLLISNGCYVIPLLSSCVFHIKHPPRSGSLEQKIKEAAENYKTYNLMLDEKWED